MEENLREFYSQNIGNYELVAQKIESLIKELIKNDKIEIHRVNSRVKNIDSYLEKAKKYKNPKDEITDYIGIRIITYVVNDLERVASIIEKEFTIDGKKSKDKSKELGDNKMGYRSIHYIASIDNKRKNLIEYSACNGCVFEIQIRTILQHSWAEIEHDKNYKYSGVLPNEIKRRLNLLSAVLESADNEFNTISHEIDNHVKGINNKIENNKLVDIEIDSASLKEFILNKYGKYADDQYYTADGQVKIIKELMAFGIKNLKEIDDIVNQECLDYIVNSNEKTTIIGFLRHMMMLKDGKKYFEECYNDSWSGLSSEDEAMFKKINPEVLEVMEKKGIYVY